MILIGLATFMLPGRAVAQVNQTVVLVRAFKFRQTADQLSDAGGELQAAVLFRTAPPANTTAVLVTPSGTRHDFVVSDSTSFELSGDFGSHADLEANYPAGDYRIVINDKSYSVRIPEKGDALQTTQIQNLAQLQDWGRNSLAFSYLPFPGDLPLAYESMGLEGADGEDVVSTGDQPRSGGGNTVEFDVTNVPDGDYTGYVFWSPLQSTEFDSGQTVAVTANATLLRFPVTLIRTVPKITLRPASRYAEAGVATRIPLSAQGGHLSYQLFKWNERLGEFRSEFITESPAELRLTSSGRYQVRVFNTHGETTTPAFDFTVLDRSPLNLLANATLISGPPLNLSSGITALAITDTGDIYFSDSGQAIRRLDHAGNLTLLAGNPQSGGFTDAVGPEARFSHLEDLTVGPDGELYAIDQSSIRRITPDGRVTTLAGRMALSGELVGSGDAALFTFLSRVAYHPTRHALLVADAHGTVLRSVSLEGHVTTLFGADSASESTGADGPLATATAGARSLSTFTLADDGTLFFVDHQDLRRLTSAGEVETVFDSLVDLDFYGFRTRLVAGTDGGLYYFDNYEVWHIDLRTGTTRSVLTREQGNILQSPRMHEGEIYGTATDGTLARFDFPARARLLDPRPASASAGHLVNLSVRNHIPTGGSLTAGFVVTGDHARPLVLRGIGPALGQFGVSNVLPQARLRWYRNSVELDRNDAWSGNDGATFGAFPLSPGSRDAVLAPNPTGGAYTLELDDPQGDSGTGLIEVYAAPDTSPDRAPVNLSTRLTVQPGQAAVAGFVLGGSERRLVLIRGIGPSLSTYGVRRPAADPHITLYRGSTPLRANEDWNDLGRAELDDLAPVFTQAGAFPLAPTARDAALAVELDPGVYTVHLEDTSTAVGEALIEIYVIQ